MSFAKLGLSPAILKAVIAQGYDTPSPIQAKAIPAVLEGRDVMGAAQTGTGKTAGFTLPILERLLKGKRAKSNHARTLVLTPTRELAAQVAQSVKTYSEYLDLHAVVVFGGVKINPQMMQLRKGADILVATPGRLLDLYSQNAVKFDQIEVLVLDEADKMLDMGFYRDIQKILALLPKNRQNLLFSATFSDEIKELAQDLVVNPVEVSVNPSNAAATTVKQSLYATDKNKKSKLLKKLIKQNQWQQVLVFTRTKQGANRLSRQLDEAGIKSLAIHGNKSQGARTKALAQFKANEIQVLVATDIAARGLDIAQLPHVVNFDLPHVSEDYVHRIGRTGRAGASGNAVSIVCSAEFDLLVAIERVIQQKIERIAEPEFTAINQLPPSPAIKPFKAKKPKKLKKPKAEVSQSDQGAQEQQSEGKSKNQQRGKQGAKQGNRRGANQANKQGNGQGSEQGNKKGNKPASKSNQSNQNDKAGSQPKKQKPKSSQQPRRRRPNAKTNDSQKSGANNNGNQKSSNQKSSNQNERRQKQSK